MIYDRKYEIKNENEKCLLKKDMTLSFNLNGKDIKAEDRHKLFFTCEDASYVGLKNESGAEQYFMLIDDSLNYEHAENSRYCLDFSCEKAMPFAKRILKKIMWQPLVYGLYEYDDFGAYKENWRVGVYAKADNLKIEKDGFLHLRFDRWSLKEGVNPRNTTLAPDETVIVDISKGRIHILSLKKRLT